MVKKMNKTKFIEKLQHETNYSKERCILINNILEQNCIFLKGNKTNGFYDIMFASYKPIFLIRKI